MPAAVQDSNLSLAQEKQGLYRVGEKLYHNKINAMLEASTTGLEISWDFAFDLFKQVCHAPATDVSLLELYKQRALQLREQYDYLILSFSGGADSDNILQTFVDNNIRLDEVWTDWPTELIAQSNYQLTVSTESTNMPAEWHFAVKPTLDQLRATNPQIKIHVSDASAVFDGIEDEYEIQSILASPLFFSGVKRYKYIQNYMTTQLKTKRACLITGVDRCIPWVQKGEYGFAFVDSPFFLKSNSTIHGNPYVTECFYWTPDFPLIPVEQARKVWDHLLKNPNLLRSEFRAFMPGTTTWQQRRNILNRTVTAITYPKWNFSKLQVDKAPALNNHHYNYVHNFQSHRFYQGGTSTLKNLLSGLNKQLCFDTRPGFETELRPFVNFHPIGKLK
jgi:hypothetical protein